MNIPVPVTGVAEPPRAREFDGASIGAVNPYTITINATNSVKAVFKQTPATTYVLTIQSPNGSGSTDPAMGKYTFNQTSTATVTATPAQGWTFDLWQLDGANASNTNPYTLNMDANHELKATFKAVTGGGPTDWLSGHPQETTAISAISIIGVLAIIFFTRRR